LVLFCSLKVGVLMSLSSLGLPRFGGVIIHHRHVLLACVRPARYPVEQDDGRHGICAGARGDMV
jgi:hypothetical protein